jgi:peptidyl-prolyl cis-trans isomerase D
MATLQNIRSKGPLLVIVIGLALFAFIAEYDQNIYRSIC